MKLLKKKEDSEWEKDIVLLILQGIPIFGILILVILGALNLQHTSSKSQSDSDKGKVTAFQKTDTYSKFSPYANFITANFITAVFQNFQVIFGLCNFWLILFH